MMGHWQPTFDGEAEESRTSPGGGAARGGSEREGFRRSYIDREGLTWEVREVPGSAVPGSRGRSCLVFESSVVIRRVWDVPTNWRQLTPDELAELSWKK